MKVNSKLYCVVYNNAYFRTVREEQPLSIGHRLCTFVHLRFQSFKLNTHNRGENILFVLANKHVFTSIAKNFTVSHKSISI